MNDNNKINAAILDAAELLVRVRTLPIFSYVQDEEVKSVLQDENEDARIEFAGYDLTPVLVDRKTIGGTCKAVEWILTYYKDIPGSFNPYNGGYPPDVEETEIGQYKSVGDCLIEIAKRDAENAIAAVEEDIMYDRMAKEEEELREAEAYLKEESAFRYCPHGLQWHECNACMVAGDLAYDAWRESRRF